MNIISIYFLAPAIIIGSYGSIFLKKGSKNFSLNINKLIKNKEILVGIFLFGLSMLLYLPALKFGNLSVIYPLSSSSYILISLLSIKHLKEKMNTFKWIGIIFIILGSFLIVK